MIYNSLGLSFIAMIHRARANQKETAGTQSQNILRIQIQVTWLPPFKIGFTPPQIEAPICVQRRTIEA